MAITYKSLFIAYLVIWGLIYFYCVILSKEQKKIKNILDSSLDTKND